MLFHDQKKQLVLHLFYPAVQQLYNRWEKQQKELAITSGDGAIQDMGSGVSAIIRGNKGMISTISCTGHQHGSTQESPLHLHQQQQAG